MRDNKALVSEIMVSLIIHRKEVRHFRVLLHKNMGDDEVSSTPSFLDLDRQKWVKGHR